MEPRIQYATAADGVSIAFWSIGDGVPVVNPPPALPWSHIELEWQIPEWRHWYEHLMETCRVIRYDGRGAGLSDRSAAGISLDSMLLDLEAVVDRAGLQRFALFGFSSAGPVTIAYAARHPERVSHLILWCAYTKPPDMERPAPLEDALTAMITADYPLFTETIAHTAFGWDAGDAAHRIALYMQEALTPETALKHWLGHHTLDVDDLLPSIQAPTLVLHRRDFPQLDVSVAQRLASRIPNARLKILEGASLSPYVGDMRSALDAINDFLGIDADAAKAARKDHSHAGTPPEAGSGTGASAGFRTIMFTDMEGSTALTQRLGDAQAQELVRVHNEIVRGALAQHGGNEVKHTGDGIMASFPTATGAVECAVAIQRAFERHNRADPREQINVRIGLNAGEPVAEGDDLFGTAVQLASRVCARAAPGEILTSDVVRQLVSGKGFLFADRGEAALRGFEDPVRMYEVRWRDDA